MTHKIALSPKITISVSFSDVEQKELTDRLVRYIENGIDLRKAYKETLADQIKHCKESTGFITMGSSTVFEENTMIVELLAVFDNMDNAIMAKLGL